MRERVGKIIKGKSWLCLLVIVFEEGVLIKLEDIVPFIVVFLKSVPNEIHCLSTAYLPILDLRAHLNHPNNTTFFKSFMLRILKGISPVSNSYVSTPTAHTSTASL